MTDYAIALALMTAVIIGVSIAGFFSIRVERRQAREARQRQAGAPQTAAQASLPFQERQELAAMGQSDR